MISNNFNKTETSCELSRPYHMRGAFISASIAMDDCSEVTNNKPKILSKKSISNLSDLTGYYDRQFKGTVMEYNKKLEVSTTLYVGRLNLASTESSIRNAFSKAGNIKTIIMGLKKKTLAPAGFCFIEYETREEAENCITTMKETVLNERKVFIDWDAGFIEGRQYERIDRNQRYRCRNRKTQNINSVNGHR